MEEHYCRAISISDVARGIYPHLASIFKAQKGCTSEVWQDKLRIDKVRVFLRESNLEDKEVAAWDKNVFA